MHNLEGKANLWCIIVTLYAKPVYVTFSGCIRSTITEIYTHEFTTYSSVDLKEIKVAHFAKNGIVLNRAAYIIESKVHPGTGICHIRDKH